MLTRSMQKIIQDYCVMIIRHGSTQLIPINAERVGRVSSFKFLDTPIAEDITWTVNTIALLKKAIQQLNFLKPLRKINMSQQLLRSFYCCSTGSGFLVWYGSSSVAAMRLSSKLHRTSQVTLYLP